MGLFSKSTTYRDFSVTRVIDDEYMPDVIGQAITKYTLDKQNTMSLTDLMLQYGWKSNAVKWNAAYRYAARPGKYTYGLPVSGMISETSFTGAESLDQVLRTLTGATSINYQYSKFGSINFRHAMWQLLVSNYNYNTVTNELTSLSAQLGTPVYLSNAINYLTNDTQVLADPASLEHWGISPQAGFTPTRPANPAKEDTLDRLSNTGNNYVQVEYEFSVTGAKQTTSVATTTVTKSVTPPGGSTTTTSSSSDKTTITNQYNGVTIPGTVTSINKTSETITNNTVTGTPVTETVTAPNGTVTQTTTQVNTANTISTYNGTVVANFPLGFGQYDFDPSLGAIDTSTVLDDRDSGNYDPNANLQESGESDADSSDWFQVYFSWQAGSSVRYSYFTYAYGTGNYPALDGITDTTVADFGKHFPRIYFRLKGDKIIEDKYANTDAYKTSVKFAKKLDMQWLAIGDEIYKSLSSLGKVRDVCIFQAVPANTSNPLEREYLFNYFKTFYNLRPSYKIPAGTTVPTIPDGATATKPVTDYDLYNAHSGATQTSTDGAMSMGTNMNAIGIRIVNGVIGAVDEYSSSTGYASTVEVFKVGYSGDSGGTQYGTYYRPLQVFYHSYKHQISATQYEEVRVYGLQFGAKVGGKYIWKSKTDDNLLVQLDYAFRKMFSPHKAETLYARATHIFIGTEYTVKAKWYQTGLFKAVVVVVSVVLSWWTAGASMSLIAVVTAAATAIGAMIIMSLLSKYVFAKLGGWFAYLAVIVAVVAIAYGGYLYLTNTVGPYSITAVQMLAASNVAFQAGQANVNAQIQRYQNQLSDIADQQAAAQQKLSDARELLENNNTITNGIFSSVTSGYIVMGETPLQTYTRTLDTNVGTSALQLASMYIQAGTSLPSTIEIIQQMMSNMYPASELDLSIQNPEAV